MSNVGKQNIHKKAKQASTNVHPWRECPYGRHWVKTHPLHVPPSHKFPNGHITTRHEHCADNPSGKDELYSDEIHKIAKEHFKNLKNKPCSINLRFKNGRKFDDLIAGWTQYWNDVLKPDVLLDSNTVKALIASESGFNAKKLAKKNQNSARGLTQITNDTRKALGDSSGELKDHLITVTRDDLNDPNINICAGIRWLFQKQKLASGLIGEAASWQDAIANYKGVLKDFLVGKERAKELMRRFLEKLEDLKKCKKS